MVLGEILTETKRKVSITIDHMAKLVDPAGTVRPFIPKHLPSLIKVRSAMGDPEARSAVSRVIATLPDR